MTNVIGESLASVVGYMPGFRVVRLTAGGFLRGSLLAKLTGLKTERRRLHRDAYSYSFYLFNPGKMMLVPRLFSVGQKRKLRFDESHKLSASSRRTSRSESLPNQPTSYLSNKLKNGQQFFTLHANY
jgi:hypothetical protein